MKSGEVRRGTEKGRLYADNSFAGVFTLHSWGMQQVLKIADRLDWRGI